MSVRRIILLEFDSFHLLLCPGRNLKFLQLIDKRLDGNLVVLALLVLRLKLHRINVLCIRLHREGNELYNMLLFIEKVRQGTTVRLDEVQQGVEGEM